MAHAVISRPPPAGGGAGRAARRIAAAALVVVVLLLLLPGSARGEWRGFMPRSFAEGWSRATGEALVLLTPGAVRSELGACARRSRLDVACRVVLLAPTGPVCHANVTVRSSADGNRTRFFAWQNTCRRRWAPRALG